MAAPANIAKQVRFTGASYLDAKQTPVSTVADLPTDITKVFNGLTITVLDGGDGKPQDYWYVNNEWQKKNTGGDGGIVISGEDVEE